ncbi:hypothetical protein C8R43DRAFT_1020955 [Mycena crocata]|nr:hypothetical protein C8R43DRAFT_1020955 [Mycena crocata]
MCYPSESQPPPSYFSRESSPPYSLNPSSTERTLQQSPRRSYTPPNGVYIKSTGNVTLLLLGQEDSVEQPSVGRGAQLNGSVLLQSTDNIRSVILTIEGLLETVPLPESYSSFPVLRITNTLYACKKEGPNAASCPHSFAFSHRFPSTLHHGGNSYSLPPTCQIQFGNSLNFIKCAYRITVTVISARHRHTSFLTKNHRIHCELNYRPRSWPSRPLICNPSLLDTVKRCPEEWAQCPINITSPCSSTLMCELFVPSVGSFYVGSAIPFHLQISNGCTSHESPQAAWSIRVYILRHIVSNVGGRIVKQRLILGEGTIRPMSNRRAANDAQSFDWEGEAQCRDPASVSQSFNFGPAVVVSDLLAVDISPPHPVERASFSAAIKLTTHSWEEGENMAAEV